MAKSSLNSELFSATNLFNNVTKKFREGVELKSHNRRLKSYKNSFIANKGVNFLFNQLKSNEDFSSKIQNRDQVINLMNIFLKWGIIVKLYPSNNMYKFEDNRDLYTLGKCEDEEVKIEASYGQISKSTNDLIGNNAESFRSERPSIYRSFGKSTYNQFNQLHNTIKKTTSTIIKSTNQTTWMSKLANQTLNKLSNRSGSNLTKKLNANFATKSSTNPIKRSTSAMIENFSIPSRSPPISRSFNTPYNRPVTRSFSHQGKENVTVNNSQNFVRNYRGHLNTSKFSDSGDQKTSAFSTVNSLISPIISNMQANNQSISLNPMNENLSMKCIDAEGNNLLRLLTKISDGLKKPLKPTNSQIIMNRDQVHYIHTLPNIQQLQPVIRQHINHTNLHFNKTCSTNPISSTCYNTLV